MKKLLFLITALVSVNTLFAQSHNNGTLSFQLNYQAGAHKTLYESKYNGNSFDRDTSAAATSLFNFTAQYSFLKFLSAGITLNKGIYIEDPENAEADGNKVSSLSFDVRAYLVNKDKFNYFFALDFGRANLEINRIYTFLAQQFKHKYNFNSPHLSIYTGFNWYFAKFLGINFQLGYSKHNFLMKKWSVNGTEQNLANFNNTLSATGVNLRLGLSIKIN